MTTSADGRRYRFGPLERRGLIAGWRGGQIAAVASGLVLAVLALRARPSVASVVAAVVAVAGGVAVAWWPIAGRTGEEWLPTVVRWGATGAAGRRRQVVGVGTTTTAVATGTRRRPGGGPFGSLTLLSVTPPGPAGTAKDPGGSAARPGDGGAVGVVVDHRRHTYTATVEVRGHSFALLGAADKDRRVGRWSAVLASLARERSVVHRLQWLACTVPDDGAAVRSYLDERAVLGADSDAHRSYTGLLAAAGGATCRHDVFLVVQVRAIGTGARAARAAGGGHGGAAAVLLHEVDALCRHLRDADVPVERVLDPPALAALIRRPCAPAPLASASASVPAAAGGGAGAPTGAAIGTATSDGPAWPWPMAAHEEWACVRVDGTWHATYWIAEWPRVDVGPDFLAPLLLGSVRRTVTVVMEPVSPSRAVRQAEHARTADLADAELRRRGGFLSTARRAREADVAGRREEELADGHASFRFTGYVTVTAPARELLAAACEATEQAAAQCRIDLRRLYGDQLQGFATGLPLGRGLA